jgi:hypothetical protein
MHTKDESLFSLIRQATEMLSDRPRCEADLIYAIAAMPDDLRTAIVLAYRGLYHDEFKQPDAESTGSQ